MLTGGQYALIAPGAEELMRAALSEPFSLDDLATAAQMSRFHFLRSLFLAVRDVADGPQA